YSQRQRDARSGAVLDVIRPAFLSESRPSARASSRSKATAPFLVLRLAPLAVHCPRFAPARSGPAVATILAAWHTCYLLRSGRPSCSSLAGRWRETSIPNCTRE